MIAGTQKKRVRKLSGDNIDVAPHPSYVTYSAIAAQKFDHLQDLLISGTFSSGLRLRCVKLLSI
jgi:hypothetical protein